MEESEKSIQDIFTLSKSTGESWFEHSKNTYHVGRFIWSLSPDKIIKYFTKDEYLWCCLFHDSGKLLWTGFEDNHTPYTKDALNSLKASDSYVNLLKQFDIKDNSSNEKCIKLIIDHHDNKSKGSEWITIADSIASSDFGELHILEPSSLNPYLKLFISNHPELQGYSLIKITFPKSSYLDRAIFGKLFLTKILREAVWNICDGDTYYLFDMEDGCKILTRESQKDILNAVQTSFRKHLLELFEKFDIIQLMGGQPQGFVRLRQYVFSEKMELLEQNLLKLMLVDILGAIQRQSKIKEIPLKWEFIRDFSTDELLNGKEGTEFVGLTKFSGFLMSDFEKIMNYDSSWMGFHNGLTSALITPTSEIMTNSQKRGKAFLNPLIDFTEKNNFDENIAEFILKKELGIEIQRKKFVEIVAKYASIVWIRKNCLNKKDERYPELTLEPLLDFISINDQLPIDVYSPSKASICAACGTFKPLMDAGQIITGFSKQQWRETIGKGQEPQPLCPLCYFSLLLYTYLTGTTKGQNVRPKNSMYLVIEGLNSVKSLESYLSSGPFDEELTKRFEDFKRRFNIELDDKQIYVPQIVDLDLILLSINPKNITFEEYPSIWKYSIYSLVIDLIAQSQNVFGVALNQYPRLKGPWIISTDEETVDLRKIISSIEKFNFISELFYDPKSLVRFLNLFHRNPAVTLSRLVKDSKMSNEQFKRGLKMVPKDKNYTMTKKLWDIVRLLNQLPKGYGKYEVIRPVKKFKGTSESLDLSLNFLLKDAKAKKERQEKAMELYHELRDDLEKLKDNDQKNLSKYVKKTTFLFSRLEYLESGGE